MHLWLFLFHSCFGCDYYDVDDDEKTIKLLFYSGLLFTFDCFWWPLNEISLGLWISFAPAVADADILYASVSLLIIVLLFFLLFFCLFFTLVVYFAEVPQFNWQQNRSAGLLAKSIIFICDFRNLRSLWTEFNRNGENVGNSVIVSSSFFMYLFIRTIISSPSFHSQILTNNNNWQSLKS